MAEECGFERAMLLSGLDLKQWVSHDDVGEDDSDDDGNDGDDVNGDNSDDDDGDDNDVDNCESSLINGNG